ncbi:MAG: hypothetical protein AB1631_34620 [Acidobacteriota bacterium]
MSWEYGGAYRRLDMKGVIELPNDSRVMVCDWIHSLPEFMKEADTLFIDPPWSKGNINCFYTKADMEAPDYDFLWFSSVLFQRIDEIAPRHIFIEMGTEFLSHYLDECRKRFEFVTSYTATYYNRKDSRCHIIHATNDSARRRYDELEEMNEEQIIEWICKHHPYDCIGDLCMGLGLVGKYAFLNGRKFVGTELNEKRLAVLVDAIRSWPDMKKFRLIK